MKTIMSWIKISEKKPEPTTFVLVYAPDCNLIGPILIGQYFPPAGGFEDAWTVYDFYESKLDAKVTHWMPLPEKP